MGARIEVPFTIPPISHESWEDIAQSAAGEASKLRSELGLANERIRQLESDLEEEKRRRLIEKGGRVIAERDRDTSTGDFVPVETATTWMCGKCASDILRHFVYCPTCSGHINWKEAKRP